jgi:hypothetical protein
MAIDPNIPRGRRAVLAAGLGGAAAFVASALGRPTTIRAANGDPVLAGQANTATAATSVANTAGGTALLAVSGTDVVAGAAKIGVYGYANQDANARAVYGKSLIGTGVWGNSDTGRGLFGRSTSGTGVSAQTDTGRAVYGTSAATDKTAILGQSIGNSTGVHGISGNVAPTPEPETGVQGSADQSTASNGVFGASTSGAGVWGATTGGLGVVGTANGDSLGSGVGVYGAGPVGVYAAGDPDGYALAVDGASFFSQSGFVTIASGSSVVVTVAGGLRTDSMVLAVLQSNRSGIWVRATVPNATSGQVTIYLNTSVPGSTKIAWFVVN